MTSIARRLLADRKAGPMVAAECPSFDTIKIQSVILGYVVAEGHREETALELIAWYRLEHKGEHDETVKAFLDLIAKGMLCVDNGKVVPFRMEHVAQAAVVAYIHIEEHQAETITELIKRLTPDGDDGSVERAVRALRQTGLAEIRAGQKVALGAFEEN